MPERGFRVWGLGLPQRGFRVWGFRVTLKGASRFGVQGLGLKGALGLGFTV